MIYDNVKFTSLQIKFSQIAFCLTERSRRLWVATEALSWGKGGVSAVSKATGISRPTIYAGIQELKEEKKLSGDKIRKSGSGARSLSTKSPSLLEDLEALVEPTAKGDPEPPPCDGHAKVCEILEKSYRRSIKFRSEVYLCY